MKTRTLQLDSLSSDVKCGADYAEFKSSGVVAQVE